MSKKLISVLLCLCMVLSCVVIAGAADVEEPEVIGDEAVVDAPVDVPADEPAAEPAGEAQTPAEPETPTEPETPAAQSEETKAAIPMGYRKYYIPECDGYVQVIVEGIAPEGATLQFHRLSDEQLAAARAAITVPEGENSFFFAYDVKLIVDGKAFNPKEFGLKVTFYFVESGLCFGDDTVAYQLSFPDAPVVEETVAAPVEEPIAEEPVAPVEEPLAPTEEPVAEEPVAPAEELVAQEAPETEVTEPVADEVSAPKAGVKKVGVQPEAGNSIISLNINSVDPIAVCGTTFNANELKAAADELYENLMAAESMDAIEALVEDMTDKEIDDFLEGLTPDQLTALEARGKELFVNSYTPPVTVPFTNAGPFMPPVQVESVRPKLFKSALKAMAAPKSASNAVDTEGIVTTKTVTENGNGTYTLRLESYVTGATTTTTTEHTTPVDIVLVLDQSGSMAYDFAGNSTSTNSDRRQYAMKQAVNSFIDSVAAKYDANDSDHRMAIVTFGSNASDLQDWTYVNTEGASTLHNAINGLPNSPSGATNAGAGMANAATLMGSGYNYTGTNTTRQMVVVLFTDGVPTTNTDFDKNVANTAISHALSLKSDGAAIFSIGIFNGADPNETHGNKWDYTVYSDIPCSGQVGTYWGGSWASSLFGNNDFDSLDVPAGNRFLNYISSNFIGADEIGIVKDTYNPGDHFLSGGTGWKINKNATRTGSTYYLTASNSSELNRIFSTITERIQSGGASVTLNSTTVVKDIVTESFEIPNGTSSIVVKTADCNTFSGSNPDWTNEQTVNLTPTIDGNIVTVTGFDFSANWVGKDTTTGAVHSGKKLILEITIEPKDGFLGGNNVPTNGTDSGIYKDDSTVANFVVPTVNIDIKAPSVALPSVQVQNKNVYLFGSLTQEELEEGAVYTVGNVSVENNEEENYGLEYWQNEFVDLEFTATPTDGFDNLTDDTQYTLNLTVRPKDEATGETASATGNIFVYKPVVDFKDYDVYYGGTAPATFAPNGAVQWKHEDTLSTAVTMIGNAPEIEFGFTTEEGQIVGGKINTKQDIPVNVTAKIGTTDITAHTTFTHTNCGGAETEDLKGGQFLLHVKTCQLTIEKTNGVSGEPYVFTVFKDDVKYTEATIVGNGKVIICELPLGEYRIQEDTGWSWRYTPSYSEPVTLSAEKPSGTIYCANELEMPYWLNGYSGVKVNMYGVTGSTN